MIMKVNEGRRCTVLVAPSLFLQGLSHPSIIERVFTTTSVNVQEDLSAELDWNKEQKVQFRLVMDRFGCATTL